MLSLNLGNRKMTPKASHHHQPQQRTETRPQAVTGKGSLSLPECLPTHISETCYVKRKSDFTAEYCNSLHRVYKCLQLCRKKCLKFTKITTQRNWLKSIALTSGVDYEKTFTLCIKSVWIRLFILPMTVSQSYMQREGTEGRKLNTITLPPTEVRRGRTRAPRDGGVSEGPVGRQGEEGPRSRGL